MLISWENMLLNKRKVTLGTKKWLLHAYLSMNISIYHSNVPWRITILWAKYFAFLPLRFAWIDLIFFLSECRKKKKMRSHPRQSQCCRSYSCVNIIDNVLQIKHSPLKFGCSKFDERIGNEAYDCNGLSIKVLRIAAQLVLCASSERWMFDTHIKMR